MEQVEQVEQVEAGLQNYVEQMEQDQGGLQIPWNKWNEDKGSVQLNLSTWPNVELQGRGRFDFLTQFQLRTRSAGRALTCKTVNAER